MAKAKPATKDTKTDSKAVKVANPRLYRVWRHTSGDESMHEIIVLASSKAEAETRAIEHVKATNPGSGTRTKATSEALTSILSVKAVRHLYCLEISTVPVAAIMAIPRRRLV